MCDGQMEGIVEHVKNYAQVAKRYQVEAGKGVNASYTGVGVGEDARARAVANDVDDSGCDVVVRTGTCVSPGADSEVGTIGGVSKNGWDGDGSDIEVKGDGDAFDLLLVIVIILRFFRVH